MGNRIHGITIEIGGDTTKLDKALKGTNTRIRTTQSALKDVERLLKLDPGNTELLAQKQRLLGDAIGATKEKLETLRTAAKGADEALTRGSAYEEKYAPLKQQLDDVSGRMKKLRDKQEDMDEAFATGKISDDAYQEFNRTLVSTQQELDDLKQAKRDLDAEFAGTKMDQSQYDALQRELAETTGNLKDLEDQARQTSSKLAKVGDTASDVSTKAGKVADVTAPLTKGVMALGAAAVATVPATAELRSDLSKLENSARQNGVGADAAREAWEKFAIATDETDSAVEATANLLQAGFTESNLQKAVEGLTGAYLAFPDTLKIESLADSLQETLATGEATGQFGELLDRLGIGAENFSAQLAQVNDQASKQQMVLDMLVNTGMMDMYESWVQNNQAMYENKDANLEMQQSMARLAETIQPIITDVLQLTTAFIDWFNGLSDGGKKAMVAILLLIGSISPIAGMVSNISGAISGVAKVGSMFASGAGNKVYLTFAKWALIILAVVAAVTALIAMINVLVGKGDQVNSAFRGMTNATSAGSRPPTSPYAAAPAMAEIPAFASGGVFKPDSPMLAVLGDNRTETEIAAPESTLQDTFLGALEESGLLGSGAKQGSPAIINMQVNGQTFARLFLPYFRAEDGRLGVDVLAR